MQSFLYEVSATDPIVFVASALTIAVVAFLASWIPALAATRVDPLEAVRADIGDVRDVRDVLTYTGDSKVRQVYY